MEAQRHELFSGIIAHATQILMDLGFPEEIADQAGVAIVDYLIQDWGGQYVTIPMDYKFRIAQRDLELYRAHRGDFVETARRFGMSHRGARKAYERVLRRIQDRDQGKLFEL